MECSLMFCQTIYSDCQSSPVMSDVDNIFVTRGCVLFYDGASCITRTLRVRGGARGVCSGQFIRYGHSAQNNKELNILSGPFPRLSLLSSEFMISMPFKSYSSEFTKES